MENTDIKIFELRQPPFQLSTFKYDKNIIEIREMERVEKSAIIHCALKGLNWYPIARYAIVKPFDVLIQHTGVYQGFLLFAFFTRHAPVETWASMHPAGLLCTHPIYSFSKHSYKIQVFLSTTPMKTYTFGFLFFGFPHSGNISLYFE